MKTEHINIRHHSIKELIEQNKISINYINIKIMLPDNFIMTLKKPLFENYQVKLVITLIKKDIIAEVEV